MSLVRYIVNLDELTDHLKGQINQITPDKYAYEIGWQRSKGFRIQSDSNGEVYKQIEIPYEEYVITGLRVGMTSMNNNFDRVNTRPRDYFHLIVNDEKVFENVYMKDITMYKNFRVPLKVTQEMIDEGLDIQFCYSNNEIEYGDANTVEDYESNIPVDVWFDIDFLAEPKLTEVTINYFDINGDELLPSETRWFSEGNIRIFFKEVEDYYIVGDYFEDIDVVYDIPIVVDFEYVYKGDL